MEKTLSANHSVLLLLAEVIPFASQVSSLPIGLAKQEQSEPPLLSTSDGGLSKDLDSISSELNAESVKSGPWRKKISSKEDDSTEIRSIFLYKLSYINMTTYWTILNLRLGRML